MTTEPAGCSFCGIEETPHVQAEARGDIHHKWTTTGKLVQVDHSAQARRQGPSPILVVGGIDTELRRILLEKGILTDEDFAPLLSARTGADGDRGTGEAPQPE